MHGGVAKRLNAVDCKSIPSGSAVRIRPPPPFLLSQMLGCSQVVRQQTLTLSFHWFDPSHPSHLLLLVEMCCIFYLHDPLAQSVEHLTFNQGVWSSSLQWITNFFHHKRCPGGGIGRRAGLKILWQLMPYRFDSGPGHQMKYSFQFTVGSFFILL
jgi:hypothetical protein